MTTKRVWILIPSSRGTKDQSPGNWLLFYTSGRPVIRLPTSRRRVNIRNVCASASDAVSWCQAFFPLGAERCDAERVHANVKKTRLFSTARGFPFL